MNITLPEVLYCQYNDYSSYLRIRSRFVKILNSVHKRLTGQEEINQVGDSNLNSDNFPNSELHINNVN